MTKRLFPLLLLMAAPALAQRVDPADMTLGMPNGRAWLKWNQTMKVFYVLGYTNGVRVAALNSNAPVDDAQIVIHDLTPSGVISDTVEFLNTFFIPENRSLPIGYGLEIMAMKTRGATDAAIDEQLRRMRRDSTDAK